MTRNEALKVAFKNTVLAVIIVAVPTCAIFVGARFRRDSDAGVTQSDTPEDASSVDTKVVDSVHPDSLAPSTGAVETYITTAVVELSGEKSQWKENGSEDVRGTIAAASFHIAIIRDVVVQAKEFHGASGEALDSFIDGLNLVIRDLDDFTGNNAKEFISTSISERLGATKEDGAEIDRLQLSYVKTLIDEKLSQEIKRLNKLRKDLFDAIKNKESAGTVRALATSLCESSRTSFTLGSARQTYGEKAAIENFVDAQKAAVEVMVRATEYSPGDSYLAEYLGSMERRSDSAARWLAPEVF